MRYLWALGSTTQPLRHTLLSSRYTHNPSLRTFSRLYTRSAWVPQTRALSRGAIDPLNSPNEPKEPKPQRFSRPTNDEIEASIIQLVNEHGQLESPTRKSNVLLTLRRDSHVLVQLDPGGVDRNPVCKIMSLKELRDQERAKEKAARLAKHTAKTSTKQIELNWSIDPHDLSHRLNKLSAFVDKGRTVEIVLTRKRGKRIATTEEIKQLLNRVQSAVEAANARQTKAMDGEPGKTLTITVEKKN